jgi:hypothetical protein
MVLSGGGGHHLYFQHPGFYIRSVPLAAGLDIKGDGGSIVAPPSLHVSQQGYRWAPGKTPAKVPLAPLPDWLVDLLLSPQALGGPSPIARRGIAAQVIPEGQRNTTLTSIAGALWRQEVTEETLVTALLTENAGRYDPPLPEQEVKQIARSVARYAPGVVVAPEPCADTSNITDTGKENATDNSPLVSTITDRLVQMHALQEELTSSPHSHDILELALAAATSPAVSSHDDTALVWLLVVGVPSSDKTNTVLLLRDSPQTFYLDTLTDSAFVSGFQDARPGKGKAPDLLPRLDGKCLVVKDLTTLFSLREDKVKKILGDLQAIYDGEYAKATGTVGVIRYVSRFTLLGCVTPDALAKHHRYMSSIGSRFLYYRVPRLTAEQRAEGFEMSWEADEERKQRLAELRRLALEHMDAVRGLPHVWTLETPEQRQVLERLAEFVAHGRATTAWQKSPWEEWEIASVQIEEPFRAWQQLRNLGRALARVHGRTALTGHELELVRRVALSSLPTDRKDVVDLFPAYPEGLTVGRCAASLGKGDTRTRSLLQELVRIGLVVEEQGESSGGKPPTRYVLVPKFRDIVARASRPLDHMLDLSGELSSQNSPQEREDQDTPLLLTTL